MMRDSLLGVGEGESLGEGVLAEEEVEAVEQLKGGRVVLAASCWP